MKNQVNKAIFMLSHGRSGTTLLTKILTAHSQIHFIEREFNEFGRFYKRQVKYNKFGPKKYEIMTRDLFRRPRMIGLRISDFPYALTDWSKINNFRDWLDLIFNYFRKRSGKPIIGVKIMKNFYEVKNAIRNINLVKIEFPDAYYLQIIRDPRDVFLSFRKIKVSPWFLSPYYFGKFWSKIVMAIRSLDGSVHYLKIHYEDLITKPRKEAERFCNFLEIDFDPAMLRFYEKVTEKKFLGQNVAKDFISDNFNKWQKELKSMEVSLISAAATSAMASFNYLPRDLDYKVNLWRKIWETIKTAVYIFINYFFFHFIWLKIDYFFGLCGLILKKYSPSFYWFLKHRFNEPDLALKSGVSRWVLNERNRLH